jgi:hypothetical protein
MTGNSLETPSRWFTPPVLRRRILCHWSPRHMLDTLKIKLPRLASSAPIKRRVHASESLPSPVLLASGRTFDVQRKNYPLAHWLLDSPTSSCQLWLLEYQYAISQRTVIGILCVRITLVNSTIQLDRLHHHNSLSPADCLSHACSAPVQVPVNPSALCGRLWR